jgi:uncharacterized coiled-coil DUF342 family protein
MNFLTNSEQTKKITIAKVRIKQMMKRIRTLESQQEMACAPIKESLRVANMRHEVFEKLYDETKLELGRDKEITVKNEVLRAKISDLEEDYKLLVGEITVLNQMLASANTHITELNDQADRDRSVIDGLNEKLKETQETLELAHELNTQLNESINMWRNPNEKTFEETNKEKE